MALIQPKPFLDNFKLRHHAEGVERRRNMSKIILENGTPFPKPIEYKDIDSAVFDFVNNTLDLSYNGKRLPTYKLFSNQKISEYSQTWQNLDDSGSLVLNFKTITRDNNPQQGEQQGKIGNVPGHRDYPMFAVSVLQENGEEAYDLYTMKQPFAVDFNYTISLITNKYELLNEFNEKIQYEFQSINCYISPNGHPMPMQLSSINDESEYNIDDRKFYSQAFKIKVMGYIIRKEDFKVTRVPSRFIMKFIDDGNNIPVIKRDSKNDLPKEKILVQNKPIECKNVIGDTVEPKHEKPNVVLSEEEMPDNCCIKGEDGKYMNRKETIKVVFPECSKEVKFVIDVDVNVTDIKLNNVYDFVIKINGEDTFFDRDVKIYNGDEIDVLISRDDEFKEATLSIIGYNPNIIVDKTNNTESSLDDIVKEEEIEIKD